VPLLRGSAKVTAKVAALAVAFKILVAHGDSLYDGFATLFKAIRDSFKIDRPVALAHRFKHFNRDDGIKPFAHVAVVLQAHIGLARQPLRGEAVLRRGDGEARDPRYLLRGFFRKAAPAAANFQYRFRRAV
jgi:hypothetical protein